MTMPISLLRAKFLALKPVMDERLTRLWAGAEAEAIGEGGITIVAEATGMSRTTIRAGRNELRKGVTTRDVVRVRRAGAGRPSVEDKAPGIAEALERLVEPVARGDLASPLRWTTKSTRRLAAELTQRRFSISPQKVGELLHAGGYRLQGAERAFPGAAHVERDEQFAFVNEQVEAFQARGVPVISVTTRKKEFAGSVGHDGHARQRESRPVPSRVQDPHDELDERILGSVHGIARSALGSKGEGRHDTPAFAIHSIAEWWDCMGRRAYPDAKELFVVADGGGDRMLARQWKTGLQPLAGHTGLVISVSHLPPGTSKWSKIEHRLICHVVEHWRGHPLIDHETVIQLIGSLRIAASLVTKAKHHAREPPTGEWNYAFCPREG